MKALQALAEPQNVNPNSIRQKLLTIMKEVNPEIHVQQITGDVKIILPRIVTLMREDEIVYSEIVIQSLLKEGITRSKIITGISYLTQTIISAALVSPRLAVITIDKAVTIIEQNMEHGLNPMEDRESSDTIPILKDKQEQFHNDECNSQTKLINGVRLRKSKNVSNILIS